MESVETYHPQYFMRHRSRETLLRKGFVEIPMQADQLAPLITCVVDGMRLITHNAGAARPEFVWRAHMIDEYGKGYEQEVGLEYKDDDERKWKFQYMSQAYGCGETGPSELRAFFRCLSELERLAIEMAYGMAIELDARNGAKSTIRKYPGRLDVKMRNATCVTRILRYPPGTHATRRAKTHIDRSFMTAHWFGSHRGLKLYTPSGSWERIDETSHELVALFPGEKFAAATKGMLGTYGTPHGVWCDEDLKEDRYAIVSFVHPGTFSADCAWLADNKSVIEAYEESLRLQ
ncbi:MAG TPA: 2OG-Fe(II) oxygenase family protein [Candidatus Paceibacterota bacterium]|nr:2OG-Fe(II) oxygenase family protein [Candidatus Paceibacterota bacterium]